MATKTVSYLVDSLSAERFAFIHPGDYFSPSSVAVEGSLARIPSLPESNFYFWKNPSSGSDLIFFLGEAQPNSGLQLKMAREVVRLAKQMGVFRLFTFAAAPTSIQHKDVPGVWGVANTKELRDYLLQQDIQLLKIGQISGLNGLLLGVASQENLPGICLLGEIPYYTVNLENPRASLAILKILSRNLYLSLDLSPLQEAIKEFDREIAQMGKKAQETMVSFINQSEEDYGEVEDLTEGAEPEEESGEETRPLPESARQRIEELFRIVKLDPAKAPLLKAELDRWGAYPRYEDRFLDLFRERGGQKDN